MGHIPQESLLSWVEQTPSPVPPVLSKRKPRLSAKKKAAAAQLEEAELRGAGIRSTSVIVNDEDSASESVVSVARVRATRGKPGQTGSSSKRELQQSPTQPTLVPKKARTMTVQPIPVTRLDLLTLEFDKDSELLTALIPRAMDVVSGDRWLRVRKIADKNF